MKQVFGFKVVNKTIEETKPDYVVNTLDIKTVKRIETLLEEVDMVKEKSRGPKWVKYAFYGFFYSGLFLVLVVMESALNVTRERLMAVVLPVLIIALVFLFMALILFIIRKKINKRVLTDSIKEAMLIKEKELFNDMFVEMDIPANAKVIDVLYESQQPLPKWTFFTPFMTKETLMFIKDDHLYIFNYQVLVSLPLDNVAKTVINKRITTMGWHKHQPPQSPKYKPYKIRINSYGHIFLKSYYQIATEYWSLYIPHYKQTELDALMNEH